MILQQAYVRLGVALSVCALTYTEITRAANDVRARQATVPQLSDFHRYRGHGGMMPLDELLSVTLTANQLLCLTGRFMLMEVNSPLLITS